MTAVVANLLGHLLPVHAAVAVGATLLVQVERLPAVPVFGVPVPALGSAVPSMAFSGATLFGPAGLVEVAATI